MFSRCSVGVVPHVDVFLMYLWGEGDHHVLLLRHLEGPPTERFLYMSFVRKKDMKVVECIFIMWL